MSSGAAPSPVSILRAAGVPWLPETPIGTAPYPSVPKTQPPPPAEPAARRTTPGEDFPSDEFRDLPFHFYSENAF